MSSGVEPQYAYLLDHWNTTLASLITMAPTAQNQFHVNLTPMIPHSQSLCSAICYMAACHLYVLKGGASLRNIVDQCQGDTIKSLRPLIGLSQHSDLDKQSYQTSLATIMILQITEALFLVRTGAEHLKGAKAIIEKGHELRTWDCDIGIFLLNICCYYDAISSVARRCPPIIDTNPYVPFLKGMQPIGDLKTLWAIIGRISGMGCQSGDTLDRHGKAIEATLQELDEHANREGDAGHTIHAYIAAAYIYLYRRWHGVGSPHPTTLRHAENCLNHLFKIPVESPLVASHVWPLFTAACETIDVQLRDGVRERLEAMYELRHLPSLQSTLNDIETAWEKKDEERARTGSDGLDCVCIIHHMKKRDPDLL
ncbi:putative fungal zn binuclear cluster domain-containing protein [Rosellinia necatrix]|uniref:Putative fungal zn binuclear cluster domain-containing protein n=1 Tax=Rosellinia necatrix TaxID=77044 RepID=A0A1W2TVU9_ROSNE|nr:putative fungal zn binuclear cluster domain-containing protein [Rosellinia necatrix]